MIPAPNVLGDAPAGVTICTAASCRNEVLPSEADVAPLKGTAVLFTSSKSGKRLQRSQVKLMGDGKRSSAQATIELDPNNSHQTLMGFGGAITDAVAENLQKVDPKVKQSIMEVYFSRRGANYNIARVPIGGSDFSTHQYTYDDSEEPDYKLEQ